MGLTKPVFGFSLSPVAHPGMFNHREKTMNAPVAAEPDDAYELDLLDLTCIAALGSLTLIAVVVAIAVLAFMVWP